jgi:hypothetical protein
VIHPLLSRKGDGAMVLEIDPTAEDFLSRWWIKRERWQSTQGDGGFISELIGIVRRFS